MNDLPRYQSLSPRGMAVAFAALALFVALAMVPLSFGMGSMMWGPYYGGPGYHMGYGFGLFGFFGLGWFIVIAALGGAIVAWVYNAVIGTRGAHSQSPQSPTPVGH